MDDIVYFKSSDKGPGLPFGIVSFSDETFQEEDLYKPSLRDFHVIFWFKKGVGKYYVDFKEYTYKPNTIVLVSKDQVHYMEKPTGVWEILSITFKSDIIYRNDSDLRHLFNFNISNHLQGQQILQLKKEDTDFLDDITGYMRLIYREWKGKSREDFFYHWICLFLIYCEKLQTTSPTQNEVIDEDVHMMMKFNDLLEQNYKSERSVSFYVNHLNITLKMLSRITHDRYKISPKQVINERVVLEMKRLLKATTRPIKEIAYELGFGEPTNMVKYFKKYSGMTPTAFKGEN